MNSKIGVSLSIHNLYYELSIHSVNLSFREFYEFIGLIKYKIEILDQVSYKTQVHEAMNWTVHRLTLNHWQ